MSVLTQTVSVQLPEPVYRRLQRAPEAMFSDAALWSASESALSPAQQHRLRQLNNAGGERPLTAAKSAEQTHLLEMYQHSLFRRAHALALLTYRGYDLSQSNDLPDFLESDDNPDRWLGKCASGRTIAVSIAESQNG